MAGTLRFIGIAADYGSDIEPRSEVMLVVDHGIDGDRYAGSVRQVTIVCTGEVAKAAAELGRPIDPAATRRNLVVDLPELPRSHGTEIHIGETVLTVWRDCAPCEIMDDIFGPGAKEALRRKAGISARVVTGGTIRIGDPVR